MIKWSDDYPGEWTCTNCGAQGWASCNMEHFEREHACDPRKAGALWAKRLRSNAAGTVDRESETNLQISHR